MLKEATASDAKAIDEFLERFTETSMFLRSNLAAHCTVDRTSDHGTRFFVRLDDQKINGVFGITNRGYCMVQAKDASMDVYRQFVAEIAGCVFRGITGDVKQVDCLLEILNLPSKSFSLNQVEPLYYLKLVDLEATAVALRPANNSDIPLLSQWFYAYEIETGLSSDKNKAQENSIKRATAAPGSSVRIMEMNGQAVAMAAINASVDDYVQVGGVFVPHELRGKGLARQVTAALLVESRDTGVCHAILFANNPAAARVYEAIGFKYVGGYRVAVLQEPIIL